MQGNNDRGSKNREASRQGQTVVPTAADAAAHNESARSSLFQALGLKKTAVPHSALLNPGSPSTANAGAPGFSSGPTPPASQRSAPMAGPPPVPFAVPSSTDSTLLSFEERVRRRAEYTQQQPPQQQAPRSTAQGKGRAGGERQPPQPAAAPERSVLDAPSRQQKQAFRQAKDPSADRNTQNPGRVVTLVDASVTRDSAAREKEPGARNRPKSRPTPRKMTSLRPRLAHVAPRRGRMTPRECALARLTALRLVAAAAAAAVLRMASRRHRQS